VTRIPGILHRVCHGPAFVYNRRGIAAADCEGRRELPHAAKAPEADFSKETDADLLTMISWRPDDESAARDAWAEFYRRHFKFLSVVCLRAYSHQLGSAGVEDLVSDTFLQVYAHGAETFRTGETDQDTIRKLVRAWLRTIAHNLFLMERRGRKRRRETVFDEIDVGAPAPAPRMSPARAADCEQVREVLDSLSERERDVLFARFWNYDMAAGKQSFASAVLADLVDRWNTTDANIRQILSRALNKIKDRLS
jgi:RNA polymerase sigma factor (sigma-70 family)